MTMITEKRARTIYLPRFETESISQRFELSSKNVTKTSCEGKKGKKERKLLLPESLVEKTGYCQFNKRPIYVYDLICV